MRASDDLTLASGRYAQLWTFRAGEVVRWKMYRNKDEAFEAAGLEGV
jgi:hypothetical protein